MKVLLNMFQDQRKIMDIQKNNNLLVGYTLFLWLFLSFGLLPAFKIGLAHSGSQLFIQLPEWDNPLFRKPAHYCIIGPEWSQTVQFYLDNVNGSMYNYTELYSE